MSKAKITITQIVPSGHAPGSYAQLHGDGATGTIDWDTPITPAKQPLFPNGSGLYGFGHGPFGHHRFGRSHAQGTAGFGYQSFGSHPFGHGAVEITASPIVTTCGTYKFAFACYDQAGNLHTGTPQEVSVEVHLNPDPPSGLKLSAYNKTTGNLTLDVNS